MTKIYFVKNGRESFALFSPQQQRSNPHCKPRSRMCLTGTLEYAVWCSLAAMNLTANADNKLWGIYHTDREYAQTLGDPLRTTVEAPTKIAAEEAAAKLGFDDPWAHPVAPEVAKLTETILKRQPSHRQECGYKPSRGIRI